MRYLYWLVVSTPLKNISQNGNLPQIGVKKKYLKPPPSILLLHIHETYEISIYIYIWLFRKQQRFSTFLNVPTIRRLPTGIRSKKRWMLGFRSQVPMGWWNTCWTWLLATFKQEGGASSFTVASPIFIHFSGSLCFFHALVGIIFGRCTMLCTPGW